MTSFILEATPRRFPRSLACCVPSPTAHVLHAKLLMEDGFCDAVRLQGPETLTLTLAILNPRKLITPFCQGGSFGCVNLFSKLCSEGFLGNSSRTRRESFTLQI